MVLTVRRQEAGTSARGLRGPARFISRHPAAYAASLAGAGTAVGIFATRAMQSRGPRRLGWAALFVLEVVVFFGILGLRAEARRPAPRA